MTANAPIADILQRIIHQKEREVRLAKKRKTLAQLWDEIDSHEAPRAFTGKLLRQLKMGEPGIIAEIKKASPSKGIIRPDFDPVAIAGQFSIAGASCLSILTDEVFFMGHLDHLRRVRQVCSLPLLRKDFIIDTYQVVEARQAGADCVLLIVAALDGSLLQDLYAFARQIGLDVLVEVHDSDELETALNLQPSLLGINNRNLRTFETRLETTLDLLAEIPDSTLVVTESGLHHPSDITRMQQQGVNTFLVGEAFMRQADPGHALQQLFFVHNSK